MSDDYVQTDETGLTGAVRRPPSLLPWILFGVTAGVMAALSILLLRQVQAESQRADDQAQAHANEMARAEKAELDLTQMRVKLEPLQKQVDALISERDDLAARVRVLTLSAVKEPEKKVEPTKPPAKKVTKKKPTKRKRRR